MKIVAVQTKKMWYVNTRGRKNLFTVNPKVTGYELVVEIKRTDNGVMLFSSFGFERLSKNMEIPYEGLEGIFFQEGEEVKPVPKPAESTGQTPVAVTKKSKGSFKRAPKVDDAA